MKSPAFALNLDLWSTILALTLSWLAKPSSPNPMTFAIFIGMIYQSIFWSFWYPPPSLASFPDSSTSAPLIFQESFYSSRSSWIVNPSGISFLAYYFPWISLSIFEVFLSVAVGHSNLIRELMTSFSVSWQLGAVWYFKRPAVCNRSQLACYSRLICC